MNHKMRLDSEWYKLIEEGKKTIEYRLNDEKRQLIKVGDTITFTKRPLEEEKIQVEVENLKYYPNLLEMYTATFECDFKDTYKDPQAVVDDTTYYSKEDVEKYGCVAIYFRKKTKTD